MAPEPSRRLGYFASSTFPADSRTIAAVLGVPPGVPEWRALRDEGAFEAAVAQIPMLRMWVDPAGVEPVTHVLPILRAGR